MDISLAKSLASHAAIKGFNIYRDNDCWFFYVQTKHKNDDADGEPFETARGQIKRYKSLDTLMKDIITISEADAGRLSIPVSVHV